MAELLEIRWHGRGGQGAKTAALLLGEAVSASGKYIQAFPEYGPERMGAPVLAFNRISEEPIRLHCQVLNPAIVVVLDATLLEATDVTAGVPEDGLYIINTNLSPEEMREQLGITGGKVYTLDATQIAIDTIGRDIPNTPMMGALIRTTGLLTIDEFVSNTRERLEAKFRPDIVEKNIQAIERAYQEVQGEE
ncbi:MAG: 2-oxoacid:acceptor oxidoreductase family protein [Bacillota bacterium]|jgi:pyruvate ferredoxin oxidoreductase gamma subunit|nr:2-oxoacid:acceptor oxidoreductase family protein [Bacillota bacterium]MDI9415165.1 2-oxoacid:acceptor oxidoreductase family protein [Bacillota bacterium]NLD12587.1 pyruvate synthase [Bacillota bacterium]HAV20478.1 pyruvate synthase [Bacillota bacterium]HCD41775.1 pyruvate synthase [Bacillota bacterium]